MSTKKITGITGSSGERFVIGAGAVYLNYGEPDERLLGATRGGNVFEPGITIRTIEVDGAPGPAKGLKRFEFAEPRIRANMMEFSLDNMLSAIPGLDSELVAGSAQAAEWTLDLGNANAGTFKLVSGNKETSDLPYDLDDAGLLMMELERLFGYGMVESVDLNGNFKIELKLDARQPALAVDDSDTGYPDEAEAITLTVDEEYDSGDSYYRLTLKDVCDQHYLKNVAIVGELSGACDPSKTWGQTNRPIICIIYNALASGEMNLSFTNRDEMVSEVVFEAHYDFDDPDTVPFEIRYPAAS